MKASYQSVTTISQEDFDMLKGNNRMDLSQVTPPGPPKTPAKEEPEPIGMYSIVWNICYFVCLL